MTQYIGILDGSGKTYGVRIPDLPGCYGGGATPEAACRCHVRRAGMDCPA